VLCHVETLPNTQESCAVQQGRANFLLANVPIPGSWKMADVVVGGRAGIMGNSVGCCAADSHAAGRRTMNCFAIDSLNKLREDKLGPGYDKTQKCKAYY